MIGVSTYSFTSFCYFYKVIFRTIFTYKGCSRCIDFIKVPALGSIRLNRTRLDILNLKKEKGMDVDESEIEEIKHRHYEQIVALKKNSTVNVIININEKKT